MTQEVTPSESSRRASAAGQTRPRISVVTPSRNHALYLGDAMESILSQNYPNLEYIVIDGGSTDGSLRIIQRYAQRLAYWASEPDEGPHDALNKGFSRATGEIMAVLNADDKHTPWALHLVADIFLELPEIEWLTTLRPLHWDAKGRAVWCGITEGFSAAAFRRGENLPGRGLRTGDFIQQESTFWRRSLWERAGGRVADSMAWDFELWLRFFDYADLYAVAAPIAGFRVHGDQLTSRHAREYVELSAQLLHRRGCRLAGRTEAFARQSLLPRLPSALRRLAGKLGLLDRRLECVHLRQKGQWTINHVY